jgi:RNA 3'-terminal phosphate cyclase (ATP)
MFIVDGAQGEGGGQIVRSSLALSLVSGRSVTIRNIRARRKRPGLMRQHLTAVQAAKEVSGAEVQGAVIGSRELVFLPGQVRAGQYHFRIGSAGSTTLVLQTVLPTLMLADEASTVTLEGGTHNPLAPPYDFLDRVYLPLLVRFGPRVESRFHRPGFYPAGGGRFSVTIHPVGELGRLDLIQRGEIVSREVRAVVARLPRHIAERECRVISDRSGWHRKCFQVEQRDDSIGPGNVVMIQIQSEHVSELFTSFGQRGVRAEKVADQAWRSARQYLDAGVPVGDHLADQLLLPMGIGAWQGRGGGAFRTVPLTPHSLTHIEVLKQLLDVPIETSQDAEGNVTVSVG